MDTPERAIVREESVQIASKNKKTKKAPRDRRKYTPEFRANVVKLCESPGESVAGVSRRFDLASSVVHNWIAKSEAESTQESDATEVTGAERAELHRLRREVTVLQMEREILKKAATFFAKENS